MERALRIPSHKLLRCTPVIAGSKRSVRGVFRFVGITSPQSGGTTFVDTMVIPYTTQNQNAAEAWINYVYDRVNYAKLVAFVQYVPVLSDMTDELNKLDPKLASNPLINPPKATLDMVKGWAPLTDEQTQEYNTLYAAVTGG